VWTVKQNVNENEAGSRCPNKKWGAKLPTFYLSVFEILNGPFVFFGGLHRIESTQVAPLLCFRIDLPGVDTILS
jgi:hypothetical protein